MRWIGEDYRGIQQWYEFNKWGTNTILVNQNICDTNVQVLKNLAKIKRVVCKSKAILLIETERIYTLME